MPLLSALAATIEALRTTLGRWGDELFNRHGGKDLTQTRVDREVLERREQRLFLRRLGLREITLPDARGMIRRFPALLSAREPKWDLQGILPGESWDQPSMGRTALMIAIDLQKAAVLNHLIAHSDLMARDPQGLTPLMHLVCKTQKHPCTLPQLSRSSRKALLATATAVDAQGRTALMHAAHDGHWPSVESLLPHSAPETRDAHGDRAFEHALLGRVESLWIPTVEFEEILGHVHFSTALDPHHLWGCVRALAVNPEQQTLAQFYWALRHDNAPALGALLDAHPQLAHHVLGDARTPLMRAASWGHTQVLRALLPHSNPNATDTQGMDAFAYALLPSPTDRTPLSEGARLLQPLSDLSRRFVYGGCPGWTALMLATQRRHTAIVQILLSSDESNRSEPQATNERGEDALMLAAAIQDGPIVQLLLPVSNPHRLNAQGQCALDLLMGALTRHLHGVPVLSTSGSPLIDWALVDRLAPLSPTAAVERALEKLQYGGWNLAIELPHTMASLERALLQGVVRSNAPPSTAHAPSDHGEALDAGIGEAPSRAAVPIEASASIRPRARRL